MSSTRIRFTPRRVETLVAAGLAALRRGTPAVLSSRHPRLTAGLRRQWLDTATAVFGDAVPSNERAAEAAKVLLRWGIVCLRPDGQPGFEGIDDHAWLHSTSWRPMLTLSCHHGLLVIPTFPARYRRRPDESPIENLCGLWAVGQSTVYRYLEKGRRQLAELFAQPASGEQLLSLRDAADQWLVGRHLPVSDRAPWHHRQAQAALLDGHVDAALWHLYRAADVDGVLEALKRHGSELSRSGEIDTLLQMLESQAPPPLLVELAMRRAALAHFRQDVEGEGEALQRALRLAQTNGEALLVGMAQGALARFFEERDRDRAIACYEDAIDHLRRAIEHGEDPDRQKAVNEYANSIVHLAWLHLRRNNPKARTLLEQVPGMSDEASLDHETIGSLEQTWGEYWRCVGNPRRALEHKHKALAIFERIGDMRSVLSTYNNLSLIYSDAKDYELAVEYGQRVVSASASTAVEPELLSSVHCNLGVAYFSLGKLDETIQHYESSRAIAAQAGLRALLVVTQYNLAEAHYERFKLRGDLVDEARGDEYAAAAARLSTEANAHAQADAARALKREVLGTGEGPDRLLPTEHAAHFTEMAEIERLRLTLAMPQDATQQIRTHLAIARAYLSIAVKEREAALALAERQGITQDFSAEIDALRQTFSRELTREQRLAHAWGTASDDLLGSERRQSVLAYLLSQGSINKSSFAEVAAVSLATASKHLGVLTERGLLVQTGKGPSTRYLLADEPLPNQVTPVLGMPAPRSAS
jgi:tetratricopeptide (TPR) repeat protein